MDKSYKNRFVLKFPFDAEPFRKQFVKSFGYDSDLIFIAKTTVGCAVKEGDILGYFALKGSSNDSFMHYPPLISPINGVILGVVANKSMPISAWCDLMILGAQREIRSVLIEETLSRKAIADLYMSFQQKRFSILRPIHWKENPFGTVFSVLYLLYYLLVDKIFEDSTKMFMDSKKFRL